MPSAASVISKLNKALQVTGPQNRTVRKRVVTRTGGDPLTGRKGTATTVDSVLSPQPYFARLGRETVTGEHALFYETTNGAGQELLSDDYQFLFSPTAVSRLDLTSSNTLFTLTDVQGNVEILRVLDVQAPALKGTEVVFIAYLRPVGDVPV